MNDFTKEDPKEIKAKIRWTIEFEYPVFDSDDEHIEFYLEESHCAENLLDYLVSESEDGICKLCSISDVKVLDIIR